MKRVIDRFTWKENGKWVHSPLSNFSPSPFMAPHYSTPAERSVSWPTVEHYYQAAKKTVRETAEAIRVAPDPGVAKKMGRNTGFDCRSDWYSHSIPVMRKALSYKFAPFEPDRLGDVQFLLDTGDALLIEGNSWNDTFWGRVPGPGDVPPDLSCYQIGDNWLGMLLMARRAELRAFLVNRQGELGL